MLHQIATHRVHDGGSYGGSEVRDAEARKRVVSYRSQTLPRGRPRRGWRAGSLPAGGRLIGSERREIGLGVFLEVGLAIARVQAAEMRDQIRRGIDPIERREARREKWLGLTFCKPPPSAMQCRSNAAKLHALAVIDSLQRRATVTNDQRRSKDNCTRIGRVIAVDAPKQQSHRFGGHFGNRMFCPCQARADPDMPRDRIG